MQFFGVLTTYSTYCFLVLIPVKCYFSPSSVSPVNNIVEQDHRAVKRLTRPMLGFKSFWAARCPIAGIEVMHAIRKGQLRSTGNAPQTPAEQFYALAA